LTDVGNPFGVRVTGEATAAAHRLGCEALGFEIRQDEDIDAAFKALKDRARTNVAAEKAISRICPEMFSMRPIDVATFAALTAHRRELIDLV
jgi:hypothetical protein